MIDINKILQKDSRLTVAKQKILSYWKTRKYNKSQQQCFENINKLSFRERWHYKHVQNVINNLYLQHVKRLRQEVIARKLKVCFLVSSIEKWHCDLLYHLFKNHKHFEPHIILSASADNIDRMHDLFNIFKQQYDSVHLGYDYDKKEYIPWDAFTPDVVFFQEPWDIVQPHSIFSAAQYALTCYTPYCFHLMNSPYNYLAKFHRFLWAYFVEEQSYVDDYTITYNANNCIAVGSLHLDRYRSTQSPNDSFWNDPGHKKLRIIYAPHFSFANTHRTATFQQNGIFLQQLASMYPQTTWIFKPHPTFKQQLIMSNMMSKDDVDEYYNNWEQYGSVFSDIDYRDLFLTSDALITDCISFLADYLPTKKPVFHLRNDSQAVPFNKFGQNIINTYYQIHNNAELERLFSHVLINGNDDMHHLREKIALSIFDRQEKSSSQRAIDYLAEKLGIE